MIYTHRIKYLINFLFLLLFLISCQNDEQIEIKEETNNINFKGLTIKNRYSLSEEDLMLPKENGLLSIFETEHDKYFKEKGLAHKFTGVINEERLIESTIEMLPYFPYQEHGVNTDMLQKDFSNLTLEEIEENTDIIDDYYNESLNRVVAAKYYDSNFIPVPIDDEGNPEDYTSTPPRLPYFESKRAATDVNTEACFLRELDLKTLDVRRQVVIYTADRDTEAAHTKYYGSLSENATKRDAFKHMIWNAFLCKYFWTVSSKIKRVAFARDLTNLWEACGDNGYGTREMDYRNNEIGRDIYEQEAKYKKNFLGITYGIDNPSNARLEEVVHDQVENKSSLININLFDGNEEEREKKAYFEIIKIHEDRVVYLKN